MHYTMEKLKITEYESKRNYYMCNFHTGGKEGHCTFVGTLSSVNEHFSVHTFLNFFNFYFFSGVYLYHCWACESYFSERCYLIGHLGKKRCDIRNSYLIENRYEDEEFHRKARNVFIRAISKEEYSEAAERTNSLKNNDFLPSYFARDPPYKTAKRAHYPDFVRRSQLRSRTTEMAQAAQRHHKKEPAEHRSIHQDLQPMDTSPIEPDFPEDGLQPPDYHPANRNVSTGFVSSELTLRLKPIQRNVHRSQSVTLNHAVIEEVSLNVHLDERPVEQSASINNVTISQALQDSLSNSNEMGPEFGRLREIVRMIVREEVNQTTTNQHKTLVKDRPPPNATSVQPVPVVTPAPVQSVQSNPTSVQQYPAEPLVSAQIIAQIPLPAPKPVPQQPAQSHLQQNSSEHPAPPRNVAQPPVPAPKPVPQQPAQNHQNSHPTQPPLIYSQDPIPASQQPATGHLPPFHPLRIMERIQQNRFAPPTPVAAHLPHPPAPPSTNSFVPVQQYSAESHVPPQNVAEAPVSAPKPVPHQPSQNHQNPRSTDPPIYSRNPINVSPQSAPYAPVVTPLSNAPGTFSIRVTVPVPTIDMISAPPPTNSFVPVQAVSVVTPAPAQSVQPNQTSVQQCSTETPVPPQNVAQAPVPAPRPVPQQPAQNFQNLHSTAPPIYSQNPIDVSQQPSTVHPQRIMERAQQHRFVPHVPVISAPPRTNSFVPVQPVSVVTPVPAQSDQPNQTSVQQPSAEPPVPPQNVAQIPLPAPKPVPQQPSQNHQNPHSTGPPIYSEYPVPVSQQPSTVHPQRIMERAQQHRLVPPTPDVASLPHAPGTFSVRATVRAPTIDMISAPPPTNSFVPVQPVSVVTPAPAQSVQPNPISVQQHSTEPPVPPQNVAQPPVPALKPVPQPHAHHQNSHSTQPPLIYSQDPIPVSQQPLLLISLIRQVLFSVRVTVAVPTIDFISAPPPTNSLVSCSSPQPATTFDAPIATYPPPPPPAESIEEIPLPQSPQRFSPRPFSPIPVRPFSPSLHHVPLDLWNQVPAPTSPSSDNSTPQPLSPSPIQSPPRSPEDDDNDSVNEEIAESYQRASRKRNRSYGSNDDDSRDPTWSPSQERRQRSRSRSERTSDRVRSKSRRRYEDDPLYIPREGEPRRPRRKFYRTRSNSRHGERLVEQVVREPIPEAMEQRDVSPEPEQVDGLLGSRENPVVLSDDEESIRDSSPETDMVREHDEYQLGSREMSIDSRSDESSPEPEIVENRVEDQLGSREMSLESNVSLEPEQDPVRSSREFTLDSVLSVCPGTPQASPKPSWLGQFSRPSLPPSPSSQRSERPAQISENSYRARNLEIRSGPTALAYYSNSYRQGSLQTSPQDYLQMDRAQRNNQQ
ncbi:hypothetical protein CRE_13369 [Caenorhabditis remanei]|uniref:Uncharacterized protein n=1 Tax=Caenorhabditis remanei TaxID=31234 RepID=E3M8F7_CAERE|nr:hypothetical protein CRE_13369 [Caenorhabditis remanei]